MTEADTPKVERWTCTTCGALLPADVTPIPTVVAGMGRSRCWTQGCPRDALFRRVEPKS